MRSIDPSIRAPSSRTSPRAVKSWMSRTVPPTFIRSAWIARPSPGSMTVSTQSSRPPTWDSHNQIAADRDWLAVVVSAPVTVDPNRLRSRRTSTPLPSNPGSSHRSTVSSCSVAPLTWSGDSNRHPSNVSGNGTVTALRSRSPVMRALRRCRPRSSTSSRRSRQRVRSRSAATVPRPSPSPQSTISPARAASITSSGATTFLLSDASSRNVTAEMAGDRRVECSGAAVHVRCVGASRAPAADWAGGQTRNQDLEVKVGKLVLTRQADPVLREASK